MLCHLCLVENKEDVTINSDEKEKHTISILLEKCFSFSSNEEDLYNLCLNCWSYVQAFHEFCVRIEEIHKNHLIKVNEFESLSAVNEQTEFDLEQILDIKIEDDADQVDDSIDMKIENDTKEPEPNIYEIFESINTPDTLPDVPNKVPSGSKKKEKSYQCPGCDLEFKKLPDKTEHFRNTHGRCTEPNCDQKYASKLRLDDHISKGHSKAKCSQCHEIISKEKMKEHMDSVHPTKAVCHLCARTFKARGSLLYHYKMEHSDTRKLQCDICKMWFKNRYTLKGHLQKHMAKSVTCETCGKVLKNAKVLSSHQKLHIEAIRERWKCFICGKSFPQKWKLREHSYIHSGFTDARKCEFCGKTFRFGSSFSAHRRKEHGSLLEEMERAERELDIGPLTSSIRD